MNGMGIGKGSELSFDPGEKWGIRNVELPLRGQEVESDPIYVETVSRLEFIQGWACNRRSSFLFLLIFF